MFKVLFRVGREFEEYEICRNYLPTTETRLDCKNCTVIARYSALPYYKELEDDLKYLDSNLINSYEQHSWIANFDYYQELKDYTFRSWREHEFYAAPDNIRYVVKGVTNSRKNQWNKKMLAENKQQALRIASELKGDLLIGSQDIIYREYIPLLTFEVGINDMPFSNEYRFFYYKKELVAYGYYWSTLDDLSQPFIDEEAFKLAETCSSICSNFVNFYAIDIAKTEKGPWVLVEVNDGQMSGLSMIDPDIFYSNLNKIIQQNSY